MLVYQRVRHVSTYKETSTSIEKSWKIPRSKKKQPSNSSAMALKKKTFAGENPPQPASWHTAFRPPGCAGSDCVALKAEVSNPWTHGPLRNPQHMCTQPSKKSGWVLDELILFVFSAISWVCGDGMQWNVKGWPSAFRLVPSTKSSKSWSKI